ncbi:hypothetical protein [Pseudonocardia sp. NPDC049154]|uniref:DUF7065 domain-containing protein n=1 Tax=Pseudonocardia sp. NPDC049154 TaxID=3155501 RepID=UPI0033E68CD2
MGHLLTDPDEHLHETGPAENWNESRYVDVWDSRTGVGGWFRLGCRPNERHAEMSACVYLPDGRVAFFFERAEISANGLGAGGLEWVVDEPWRRSTLRYSGEVLLLDDPWSLTEPGTAFKTARRAHCDVELTSVSEGLESVMGFDQDHIDKIFLPGQADFHYQHLARTSGRIRIGETTFEIDGRGGKDHSWGPRNWHAKIWLRWLICSVTDDTGFMLVRAVGPTKRTRSGFVWDEGRFHLVDDFVLDSTYGGEPWYPLQKVGLEIRSGERTWRAHGVPQNWLPVRHRGRDAQGDPTLLRIVKSPTTWTWQDGRTGEGHCEYHDLMRDGVPVGQED